MAAAAALLGTPQTLAGAVIVAIFLLIAAFGQVLAPYSANDQSHLPALPPQASHPFGTDYLGRDVYSRVILGARSIIGTAGLGTLMAVAAGTAIGLVIAYQGGLIDEIVGRVFDTVLAIPPLVIALVVLGIVRQLNYAPGNWQERLIDRSVLLVIFLVYVPLVARVVRSASLAVKTREFVAAAQLRGESRSYILFREMLPSVAPVLVAEASLRFAYAIFLVASLGFLGVGASPPAPDWGLMVSENRGGLYAVAPWALNFPAAAIACLVVGVTLLSDGVRQALQRWE